MANFLRLNYKLKFEIYIRFILIRHSWNKNEEIAEAEQT